MSDKLNTPVEETPQGPGPGDVGSTPFAPIVESDQAEVPGDDPRTALVVLRDRIESLERAVFGDHESFNRLIRERTEALRGAVDAVGPKPRAFPFIDVPVGRETTCPHCKHHFTVGNPRMGCPNPNCELHA